MKHSQRVLLFTALLSVNVLVGRQPVMAAMSCEALLAEAAPGSSSNFAAYLKSEDANFETVKEALKRLEEKDTSSVAHSSQLAGLAKVVNEAARELILPPTEGTSLSQLETRSRKLRLLNTPAVRNLLGDGELANQ